jgi:hypothetical protein
MKTSPNNRFVKSLDLVIDFATLGEYRVVTDAPVRIVDERDVWATDIEWSQAARTSESRQRDSKCSLPRARKRNWEPTRARS